MKELAPVILASLVGSLHCVGMCGGLVSFYAGSHASGVDGSGSQRSAGPTALARGRWAAHGAYHLTRLLAYAALGASAGQLGAALDGLGHRAGLAALGSMVAALVMLLWAMPRLLGKAARERLLRLGRGPTQRSRLLVALEARLVALADRARQKPPVWRASALGLSSALLPCGWLYAFVVLAAGAGSGWGGALLLAAFWLGTVPALLGLGLGVERLSRNLRAHLPRLGAALVILVGGWNVVTRWPSAALSDAPSTSGPPTPSCHAVH